MGDEKKKVDKKVSSNVSPAKSAPAKVSPAKITSNIASSTDKKVVTKKVSPAKVSPAVGVSGNKKLIIGIVVSVVVIGVLVGAYFMFFAEPSSVEEKFRKDLKPVLKKLNSVMEMGLESAGSAEEMEVMKDLITITTEIVEINDLGDGRWEAIVNTGITAFGQGEVLVSKYYYDVDKGEIVTVIMVSESDGDTEQSFDEFMAGLDLVLAMGELG